MVYYGFAFFCLATIANAAVSPKSLNSDISIVIHNDLLEAESPLSGSGILVLDARPWQEATESCQKLGGTLWGTESSYRDIRNGLDYLVFQGKYTRSQRFWTASDHRKLSTIDTNGRVNKASAKEKLPVLCTQSAPLSNSTFQDISAQWQVTVHSNDEYLTGFRDRFSFRFLGIRYAKKPRRWDYAKSYRGTGKKASALNYGSDCTQGTTGSEDCLFLNVWTPYLPKSNKVRKSYLKPVMLWIHGGAFIGGTGSDPTFDGSNLASRGDVVVVTINYRVGTLGFLALDDGKTNGNYGLADQTTALEWVRRNIQDFGGDPDRVTIFGQSAGAASVRALLASPVAQDKFAGAIMQSNLGGLAYGTTFSKYYTIAQEMDVVGNAILNETKCTDAASPVECLRKLPASTIANLADSARYLVVDGVYLQISELDLTNPASTANVPLMIGMMRDDDAAILGYPRVGETLKSFLNESDLPDSVVPSQLFPVPSTANATLDIFNTSSRIATDAIFRCINKATAHTGSRNHIFPDIFYYEFNRSYQMPSWSPNAPVCNAPITDEFPNGDPSQEYFKCHSGELFYVFGSFRRQGLPFRDELDLPFGQYVLDSWASFARVARPTPDLAFLKARGYYNTTREIEANGPWESFRKESQLRLLQWPSGMRDLDELEQCRALKLPLNYFDS
ncbi:uncharacterized protein N7479_007396 [Penicillium vulpinum]|uniref:Carboxylic ester hydrolase n=1 Tax=Penicillium vulpinum TaxID=29845 RepID=A0A1V6SAQ5_9EURO|nr:uncharacterized protein N7479_007396 [Penicillium vulpinum]KAJ5960246.1 hypothetical protein N7479_007396 [Penicillium vulpinum]OQE10966.1 hypothetical protein PENVUL_c003G09660 [Penicillium vulpinum]